MSIVNFILGALLVLSGRKLFWLFVGGMGFVLSLSLALQIFQGQPSWVLILFALFIGIIGALLAVFIQKAAVILGGFLAGAYLLGSLASGLHLAANIIWLPYLVGGILGGGLVVALFEWSLIVMSSLVGAVLIVEAAQFRAPVAALIALLTFLAGIGIQSMTMSREGHPNQ